MSYIQPRPTQVSVYYPQQTGIQGPQTDKPVSTAKTATGTGDKTKYKGFFMEQLDERG